MGHERTSEVSESQRHKGPDLKQLSEHQESLRHFMENWFAQHDQILQSITDSMQTQDELTSQTLQLEEDLALGPQDINQEASSQPPARDSVQMCNQAPRLSDRPPRSLTRYTDTSDILRSVRYSSGFFHQATHACRGSMSSLLERKLSSASAEGYASETMVNQRMVKLVSSQCFECLCSMCIITNAIVIACAADYAASHVNNPRHPVLEVLEMGFAAFYVIEWALRLVAYRLYFFLSPDALWNLFDTFLVVSAAYDLITYLGTAGQGRNPSVVFLRIVRVMKMLKLLRMIRIMRLFRELRLIASLMRASLKPLVWAVVLISIISYIAGICFLQAGTIYLQEGTALQEDVVAIQMHWGSVWRSMLSLYMASTNGDSWKSMANALKPVGDIYYLLFLLYIAFFVFVVMNTLTSLFLEAVIQTAEKDTNTLIREELRRTSDYVTRAAELFRKIDQDGSGDVTEDEFIRYARNAEMTALASSLELDVSDMAQFYKMLSCRGKYAVDVDTFSVGCMKLKGYARSMDLQALIAFQKKAARTLEELVATSESTAALVQQILPTVQSTRNIQGTRSSQSAVPRPAPSPGDAEFREYL